MLFDRPHTRVRAHFGSFDLVPLVWPHSRWEWQAIIPSSPVVTIVFYHAVEVSCYHFFGRLNRDYVYALLLWGLLLVSASRYSVKVCRMLNLSALTFKSASRSCLRIHLDCLTAIKSNLFGLYDCLKRCRGGHQGALMHFLGFHELQQCDCLENLPFLLLAFVGVLAPRKDDGTDFGCI